MVYGAQHHDFNAGFNSRAATLEGDIAPRSMVIVKRNEDIGGDDVGGWLTLKPATQSHLE